MVDRLIGLGASADALQSLTSGDTQATIR